MEASPSLTAEMIADQCWPRELHLAPDGRRLVYAAVALSKAHEHAETALWVVDAEGSNARRLTAGAHDDRAPQWSPDGRRVAFLSDRQKRGVARLFCIAADGGEALPMLAADADADKPAERGIGAFAWSPDGGWIAFVSADEPSEDDNTRTKRRDDAVVWGERLAHGRLRLLDVATGGLRVLFSEDEHVAEFAWSPDGSAIALITWPTPKTEGREWNVRLHIVDVASGNLRHRHTFAGSAGNLVWSPTGTALYFCASADGKPQDSAVVWRIGIDGGNPEHVACGADKCAMELQRAGGRLIVTVAEGLKTLFYALDPASHALTLLHPAPNRDWQFEVLGWHAREAEDSAIALALSQTTGSTPPEVRLLKCSHGRAVQLGTIEPESAACAVGLCTQEPFFWQAPDGLALDGLLIRPNAGPGPWPTFVQVHGGPYARSTPGLALTWARWGQWLAGMGIAVLLPNYRGGMGHGSAFARWARGGVGLHDFQDVTSMVDAAIARGIARPGRVGIGGWSQGGFMTAWAVTQTNRFRCGIMGAGVSDWGMLLTNDLPVFEQALGGDAPCDGLDAQQHRRTSPITYARNARTPLLILHGEDDERVPVNQAVAFHRALRANGTPATFVRYPREPHAIGERAHQIDLLNRVRDWCTEFLLSESL